MGKWKVLRFDGRVWVIIGKLLPLNILLKVLISWLFLSNSTNYYQEHHCCPFISKDINTDGSTNHYIRKAPTTDNQQDTSFQIEDYKFWVPDSGLTQILLESYRPALILLLLLPCTPRNPINWMDKCSDKWGKCRKPNLMSNSITQSNKTKQKKVLWWKLESRGQEGSENMLSRI